MLKSSGSRRAVQRLRRGVFDYLAATKAPAKGSNAAAAAAQERSIKEGIPWDFIEWYRPEDHKFAEELDCLKQFFGRQESYAGEPSRPYKAVDWNEWKSKIADPAFVDEVKADFHAEVDIANSFTNPAQAYTWSAEAKKEVNTAIKQDATSHGYQFPADFKPPATYEAALASFDASTAQAQGMDAEYERHRREVELDYEQVEAERDMFGVKGEMMDYALHPQLAEMEEEETAGKQTYVDKVLEEWEFCIYAKRERLAQLQDETHRQAFMERWKRQIKIHGYDEALGQ